MDEILIPPSAFKESINSGPVLNNSKSYNLGFDSLSIPIRNQINNFSQTDYVKRSNKGSLTTEVILTGKDLKEKLSFKKMKYIEKINSLKQDHIEKTTDMNDTINNLTKQLSDINQEKVFWQEQFEKMKIYIHGVENIDVWLQEKQRLMKQIEDLEIKDKEKQITIELLEVQLSNIEKIQLIQEKELVKDFAKSNERKPLSNVSRYESTLRAWRHKVLSLLVQQQSTDVLLIKEKQNLKLEIEESQNENDHNRSTLKAANLKLQVTEAQLTMKDAHIEKLRRENDCLQNEINAMNEERLLNSENMEALLVRLQQFQSFLEKETEIKFHKANAKCDGLQRRLDFALTRFPVIHANMVRSKNVSGFGENIKEAANSTISMTGTELRIVELQEEIEQLKSERDSLVVSIEQDSATFHQRINEKKQELHDELISLQSSGEQLQQSLSKKRRELELFKNENVRMKSRYEELLTEKYKETENLQAVLSEMRTENSRLSLEFNELKRSSAFDKMKMEEKVQKSEENLKEREALWSKKIQQIESECNLLKITIRQEGILSKLKPRPTKNDTYQESKKSFNPNSEMECVLKDLENLTEQLKMNDCG